MIKDVEQAIQRALHYILETQLPDGSWHATIDTGPALTAQGLVALHYLGRLDPGTARSCLRWIRWQQLEDGAFPSGTGDHAADPLSTALCLAAFTVCGFPEYERPAAGARSFLDSHGGMQAVTADRSFRTAAASVYLALAGLLDPAEIPAIPILAALAPAAARFFESRIHPALLLSLLQLDAVRSSLLGGQGLEDKQWPRRLVAEHLVAGQASRQNAAGDWNASSGETMAALIAFRAAGLPPDDVRIQRGLDWLLGQVVEDVRGTWFREAAVSVPATALTVQALAAAPAGGTLTAITAGLDWLSAARGPAGWAEQLGNLERPKTAATGAALAALGSAMRPGWQTSLPPETAERMMAASAQASGRLRSLQNADGGWPFEIPGIPPAVPAAGRSFDFLLPDSLPGWWRFFREPPPRVGDPSSPAFTAEVLNGLACVGYGSRMSMMRSGMAFLQSAQSANGSWNDSLLETALVLRAIGALRYSDRQEWVRRGADYLVGGQCEDGGWPEENTGERDAGETGAPWLTGLACSALIGLGFHDSIAVNRGVLYLLQNQLPSGGWVASRSVIPPTVLPEWRYSAVDAGCFSAIALSAYRQAVLG